MDESELELYNLQLTQVTTALTSDPENVELQTLRSELENLISLTQSLAQSTSHPQDVSLSHSPPPPASNAAQAHSSASIAPPTNAKSGESSKNSGRKDKGAFTTGQEVLAKYTDGRLYPARIVSIAGDPKNPICTVVYKGYGNSETLPSSSLKHISSHPPEGSSSTHPPPPPPTTSSSTSHPPSPPSVASSSYPPPPLPQFDTYPPPSSGGAGSMDERAIRKHRNEKKLARREEKTAIQVEKAASWQKFANKATKNKTLKKSIFGTDDADPYAKVGVTKSGKGKQSGVGGNVLG